MFVDACMAELAYPAAVITPVAELTVEGAVQKVAMEKEAMSKVIVDAQGTKLVQDEEDRRNFELHPFQDKYPLDVQNASQEEQATLQTIVNQAAKEGCIISNVQLWSDLLAEDKEMKITWRSRKKVR